MNSNLQFCGFSYVLCPHFFSSKFPKQFSTQFCAHSFIRKNIMNAPVFQVILYSIWCPPFIKRNIIINNNNGIFSSSMLNYDFYTSMCKFKNWRNFLICFKIFMTLRCLNSNLKSAFYPLILTSTLGWWGGGWRWKLSSEIRYRLLTQHYYHALYTVSTKN